MTVLNEPTAEAVGQGAMGTGAMETQAQEAGAEPVTIAGRGNGSGRKPISGHRSQRASRPLELPGRIKSALEAFVDAVNYAEDLGTSVWDFALEMPSLYRMRLSISDLRWLVGRGLLEHAVEVTQPGDVERSFRRPPRLLICRKTCFVLTESGLALARGETEAASTTQRAAIELPPPIELPARDTLLKETPIRTASQTRLRPMPPSELIPRWDSDRQELKVGPIVVKRFRVPAESQETILAAFEEECWPARIDDPLPPRSDQSPKRRLQETIKSLNRNQKRHVIRFLGDGNGQGVLWEFRRDIDLGDLK